MSSTLVHDPVPTQLKKFPSASANISMLTCYMNMVNRIPAKRVGMVVLALAQVQPYKGANMAEYHRGLKRRLLTC